MDVGGIWQPDKALLDSISSWLMVSGVMVFCILMTGYIGTYGKTSGRGLTGLTLPARFTWCIQEIPCVLWVLHRLVVSGDVRLIHSPVNIVLVGLFLAHYIYRSLIYPFRIRNPKPVPVFVFLLAVIYCNINGYLQSSMLLIALEYPTSWFEDIRFIGGLGLFMLGAFWTHQSDHILINLRKAGEREYKIPRGGMFEYVSSANLLGETVMWAGFAVACWNLAALSFVVYTFCNLFPRAVSAHSFYNSYFKDKYPKDRRIMFPFLI